MEFLREKIALEQDRTSDGKRTKALRFFCSGLRKQAAGTYCKIAIVPAQYDEAVLSWNNCHEWDIHVRRNKEHTSSTTIKYKAASNCAGFAGRDTRFCRTSTSGGEVNNFGDSIE